MKNRQLNFSAATYDYLARNRAHQFATNFALRIYRSNSIYSFIPKNACSTMRVSLAMANGCISEPSDFNWIHQNNSTFTADLASLQLADYTFVILRCPYARLASAYLDKIVDRTAEAWQLYETLQRKTEISALNFKAFVKAISTPKVLLSNIHWQPQSDFLVYKTYDDYFSLEQFAQAKTHIETKAGLQIVDARPLTQHGTDRFQLLSDDNYAEYLPDDIYTLKKAGKLPSPAALYDDETQAIVSKLYKQDLALYKNLFGIQDMLFS